MKKALCAVVVLALAVSLAAAEWRDVDITQLMQNAPDKEQYPDASALFLYLQEMTDVAPDGSITTMRNKLTSVLTLMGREQYSNPSFYYDTDRTTIELLRGVTVRKTGREVAVEEDGINDITPAFLEGATTYANVLEKVISFPVAGPGSTMDLQTVERTTPALDAGFSAIEYMGDSDPILRAEFTLKYPADVYSPTYATFAGLLGDVRIAESVSDGQLVFTAKDVPALVEEESMPPRSELLPTIMYSSYSTWDEPAAFMAAAFYPHVQTGGDVAARAAEVTAGAATGPDKIKAVFLDVTENIRNVNLSLGLGGYEPNDASLVLSNKYADTRDKAVLLVSMLRAAGVDAYPAAVRQTRGRFETTVPTLRQFNRLLVAVPSGGGYDFLDPFLDDVQYGFLRWGRGNIALVVKDDGSGELVEIPGFDPSENRADKSMKIALGQDGSATVTAMCDLVGYFDRKTRMTLKDATDTEEGKAFDGYANIVSAGATDVEHSHSDLSDLTEPVSARQVIDAPDFAVPQGDMMIVRVPRFPLAFASVDEYPHLAERKYPFELSCENTTSLSVNIALPDGYEVVRLPDAVSSVTDAADMSIDCTWDKASNSISWRASVVMKTMQVPTESYAAFKAASDDIAAPRNNLILLRKM